MTSINVVNKRNGGKGIYIGRGNRHSRGSPLGNPFKMQHEADRARVVKEYNEWLQAEMKQENSDAKMEVFRIAELVRSGQEVNLVCWCAPKACHGDVVKQTIVDVLSRSRSTGNNNNNNTTSKAEPSLLCKPIRPHEKTKPSPVNQDQRHQQTKTKPTKQAEPTNKKANNPKEIDPLKRVRKIRKLLRQINELKAKNAQELDEDQLKKIETEPTLQKELESLEMKNKTAST